jgi:hypothetical protein
VRPDGTLLRGCDRSRGFVWPQQTDSTQRTLPNAGRSLAHPPRQAPPSPLQPLSANALNFIRDKRSQLKQHQRMPSRRLRQPHSRWRQEAGLSRHNEKPVDIEKKAIDTASYKLYYVNYEIRSQNSFHSSSLTKGLTNAAFCPIEPLARH